MSLFFFGYLVKIFSFILHFFFFLFLILLRLFFSDMCPLCWQVVSSRLQMTQGLLQKTVEEQGASEAIGDKLCKKAVCLMDDITALADRYYAACSALKTAFNGLKVPLNNYLSVKPVLKPHHLKLAFTSLFFLFLFFNRLLCENQWFYFFAHQISNTTSLLRFKDRNQCIPQVSCCVIV